jgi:hypothetical protein
MRRRILFLYQILTGLSDSSTGLLLIVSPAFTLHLMRLHATTDALPFLSYIGAFVISVGFACLYGAFLTTRSCFGAKLEVVWLLTATTRGIVAVCVIKQILDGTLETGWITVAISDGGFALLQTIGLAKGWLTDAA